MKPLRKGFEATEKTITVKIEGEYYEVANLKKSGLLNQVIVLIAYGDKWHEVNVLNLGGDDSNLESFKSHVELHDYKLRDFGIYAEEKTVSHDYNLKHPDFLRLEAEFPHFSYIKIAKLDTYYKNNAGRSSEYIIRSDLKRLTDRGETIDQWIEWSESQKKEIINNDKPKFLKMKTPEELQQRTEQREFQLFKFKMLPNEEGDYNAEFNGQGFTVTKLSIESDTEDEWNSFIAKIEAAKNPTAATVEETDAEEIPNGDYVAIRTAQVVAFGFETEDGSEYKHATAEATIPFSSITDMDDPQWHQLMNFVEAQITEPEPAETTDAHVPEVIQTPTADNAQKSRPPVSIVTIGELQPSRISELQMLSENQDKVLVENPLMEVTDAETLKKAKAQIAVLLKASTAIDSPKTGIKADKNRYLKKLSDTLDAFLDPLAKKTRDRYDKQKAKIDVYESAEETRKLQEQKDKVAKINERTAKLFAVPMVFNGELYTIGTIHILPSQIEKSTDEEFDTLLKSAQAIKHHQDDDAAKPDPLVLTMAKALADATGKSVEVVLAEMKAAAETPAEETKQAPAPVPQTAAAQTETPKTQPAASAPAAATATKTAATPTVIKWEPDTTFAPADPANVILTALDAEHAHAHAHHGYIKCRAYWKRGTKDLAAQIRDIFASDHPVKSQAIKELLTIIENS